MVKKYYGHAIWAVIKEKPENKTLKLVIIKVIDQARIKMGKVANFGSPINSIEGLIEEKKKEFRIKLARFA
jgi:hypothetical protein